jgi:hypothetical protein
VASRSQERDDGKVFTRASTSLDGYIARTTSRTFRHDGSERAIDKAAEIAGDRVVGVNGGTIARQCLDAGRP